MSFCSIGYIFVLFHSYFCVLWLELCPPKRYVQTLNFSPRECDIIRKYGLGKCDQVKLRSHKIRVCLNSMTDVKGERNVDRDTEGRRPWDHRSRDWSDATTSWNVSGYWQGQMWGRCKEVLPLEPSETAWPCQHVHFRLLTSRTGRISFCCFKPLTLWSFTKAALGNTCSMLI